MKGQRKNLTVMPPHFDTFKLTRGPDASFPGVRTVSIFEKNAEIFFFLFTDKEKRRHRPEVGRWLLVLANLDTSWIN